MMSKGFIGTLLSIILVAVNTNALSVNDPEKKT